MPAILQYDFMVRALIGGVLVGGLAPVLGTFLVLRRFSLLSDTLAHVALFGVAVGFAVNVYPTLTTFVAVTSLPSSWKCCARAAGSPVMPSSR